ncbi:MAG: archease [Candidatus Omnitrophota bacterium]
MKDYEVIEHTADIGIRVKAKDPASLFKSAGLAMFDIIAEAPHQLSGSAIQQEISIKQEAGNLEELLVFWLNELLSLSNTKELIFFDFKVNKLEGDSLQALAFGRPAKDCKVNVEIKAATYHGLRIWQESGLWQAEVIFDV